MGRRTAAFDKMLSTTPIAGLTRPARVIAVGVVLLGAVSAVALFVFDLLSDDSSSTGGLILLFMAIYVAIGVGIVALADQGIAELRRRHEPGR